MSVFDAPAVNRRCHWRYFGVVAVAIPVPVPIAVISAVV